MYPEAHAAIGWTIGTAVPSSDRRLRNWCVVASLVPDVDAISYLAGPVAYMNWHHVAGHSVFVGAFVIGAAIWHHRGRPPPRRWLAGLTVGLSWLSHLLTDAWFTRYPISLLWPLSDRQWSFAGGTGLADPVNIHAVYAAGLILLGLAWWRKVTPVDIVSPALDSILTSPLRGTAGQCIECGRDCNLNCSFCASPLCVRHGTVDLGLRVRCPACSRLSPGEDGGRSGA